ncbi:MAG: polysaccharide biosynthesis/export family protein [Gammaproteobacteria bacterium]
MNQARRVAWAGACVLLCFAGLQTQAFAQAAAPAAGDYTVNAGDQLDISVWKELDLTKSVVVRPDGKFSFPLAGEVNAAGRTIVQIQNDLTAKLKTYIPEPVVTASIKVLDGYRVYVIGQVARAGPITMNPRMNVLQALSVAGGMTPFAALNDIIILRGAGGNNQRLLPFHYSDVSKGKNLTQNVQLEAGDVVIVP